MKFEVINSNGKVVMHTQDDKCLYDKPTLLSMQKFGYKFKLNDRFINRKKIGEGFENSSNI